MNHGDEIEIVESGEAMHSFLGAITSREEALFLIASHDYSWSDEDLTRGGIRDTKLGFEIIATRITSICQPIERPG